MKTMVSTIICLYSNKKVILLDEPVLGFDVIMRSEFYEILLESFERNPRIIAISTHIIDEISKTIMTFENNLSIDINNGDIILDNVSFKNDLNLNTKNGNILVTLLGNYDDFNIQSKVKKGKSNLPESKSGGSKDLIVITNGGDINIIFK